MNSVSVNIVMTYPVHWTKYQVLRDFVQNFYDAAGYEEWRDRFQYKYENNELSMWLDDVSFNYEWLLHIGASTKTSHPDGYAGFFGEGFKIASLCAYRDMQWDIRMMSNDWLIDVTDIEQYIDNTPVRMLAYNIVSIEKTNQTKLILNNITSYDYDMFKVILDSFFSSDNPIMGRKLWQGRAGAVYIRSRKEINHELPYTSEYGRKGAVFCGYQMLGTNPFDLVVCLHNYDKTDRERRNLYTFEVIRVFEKISQYVDPMCAMEMLEKMKRYWNTYPHRRIDIHSWSGTIDTLIMKVSYSSEVTNKFVHKYDNLLCLKRINSIPEKNRRWQARSWLEQQSKQYRLVKDTFKLLGYPLLEEECEKYGGFVIDDGPNSLQEQCFAVLEDVCKNVFQGFFDFKRMPERKIIQNRRASYHGMAVIYKKKEHPYNIKGIRIRYDIGRIYLKSEVFTESGYYDALSTYMHEMCHMFGGDSSASFSQALTMAIEILMENYSYVQGGNEKCTLLFKPGTATR